MKIGIVTESYYPRFSGVTEHVHHSALELERLGHDVTIVTSNFRREERVLPQVERLGRNVVVPFNGSFADCTVGWRLERRLRRIFRRRAFDLIHIHAPPAPGLPLLALRAAECPQVGTFHMTGRSRIIEVLRDPLARQVDRLNARIAVSATASECAQRYFSGVYQTIPNGVDVERFHPDREAYPAWRSRGLMNVLFVGRLDPRKGVSLLIAALPELVRRARGRVRLLVIGDSYLRPFLEASVPSDLRGHIVFLGAVPRDQLPRWYATADIFVSPAMRNESQGIVLLEAMASGCPVVCADIPGYRTAVTAGETAILHEPGSASGLADALHRLVEDGALRARLAANGRLRALDFAWPKIAARIETVYLSAASNRSGAQSAA